VATMRDTPKARGVKRAPSSLPGTDYEKRKLVDAVRSRMQIRNLDSLAQIRSSGI
jgi:hypothetical protein